MGNFTKKMTVMFVATILAVSLVSCISNEEDSNESSHGNVSTMITSAKDDSTASAEFEQIDVVDIAKNHINLDNEAIFIPCKTSEFNGFVISETGDLFKGSKNIYIEKNSKKITCVINHYDASIADENQTVDEILISLTGDNKHKVIINGKVLTNEMEIGDVEAIFGQLVPDEELQARGAFKNGYYFGYVFDINSDDNLTQQERNSLRFAFLNDKLDTISISVEEGE